MRQVLAKVFKLNRTVTLKERWSFTDFEFWKGEKENYPDNRYNRNPKSPLKEKVFIVGMVRNPFSYYRSLYNMLTSRQVYSGCKTWMETKGAAGTWLACNCETVMAWKYDKSHLFLDEKNLRTNVTAFHDFIHFLFNEAKVCNATMQLRHDHLMLMNDGSMAYDAVVKQEDYYPMLRHALKNFDECKPNVTHFDVFDKIEKADLRQGHRIQFSSKKFRNHATLLDPCFYSPFLRRLVEDHDRGVMTRYNYTWESFAGNITAEDCLVTV